MEKTLQRHKTSVYSTQMEFVQDNAEVQDEAALLELLAGELRPFYEPRLPYHNWDEHIKGGLKIVTSLCEQEKASGKPINMFMAQVAYMGHDAGYPHDLVDTTIWQPYGSKEGYSAHIMEVLLKQYDFDETFIEGVKTCIMYTKMDESLPTDLNEELLNTASAVRTADLSNVFGSYRGFVMNSFKLMEEDRVYGRIRDLGEFKKITKFVLGNFLDPSFSPAGNCKLVDGLGNVEQFVKDTPSRLLRRLGNQATRFSALLNKGDSTDRAAS